MKLSGTLVFLFFIFLVGCSSAEKEEESIPYNDYVIDSIDDIVFDLPSDEEQSDDKDVIIPRECTFVINVSSSSYDPVQRKNFNMVQLVRNARLEGQTMTLLSRYDRLDLKRSVHVRLSFNPSSGRIMRYRLTKSSYVREIDNLVMKDVGGLRIRPVRKKVPSSLMVVYIVRLKDMR